MTKESLDVYDKLLIISTSCNLGYLTETQVPQLLEYLRDKVCDLITENFSEMSYRDLWDTIMYCSHTQVEHWTVPDLCEEIIEYYSNWCQTDKEINDNEILNEIQKLIHEAITPIEFTKLIGQLEEQNIQYYYS
jgi:hypothetical protein